ncbi:hypothetical protein PV729_33830 [Streptomyces europaeiscabiei]|uniref:Secreted protein n=1 Tax=Streptomyces europaeiscabiei TaxID=146819 RepID=A0ABU4NML2_9ACTN|nr:hypothetical protein [Streptomyces europaeiscabiei]MDX3546972.1 hypothetical protein [Streptomyces europaeiscabiei]MDX3556665.1 hypothetical protein [Streptomyces europaeiscabiei]MDX3704373.1 hypothetical protein [Streptomyces europaeiscabiei]
MRNITRLITATAVIFAGITVSGGTAHADSVPAKRCTDYQDKRFPTQGANTLVQVKMCIEVNSSYRAVAKAYIAWIDGEEIISDNKFDYISIQTRLEQYNNTITQAVDECNLNDNIDTQNQGNTTCTTPSEGVYSVNGFTADATVYYDINGDGEGMFTWELTGSPSWSFV